ncbi:alpha/beta fold hydrolase [Micromonospora echinofusca]|uniref:Alpha/beta fold hydrolase n=1 Tax=Micromonospora echinofusca TaxID=47858 RepID=A0ABS3VSB9_MICEH|nr:alpha/beta fold hydrolase [Micromonospora echinofusca]MBO4207413.1 alpha/beta fold hydrolase [Micromonospora echinofusca]
MTTSSRHALVFGGSGLIGRHLILALHRAGVRVTTANRSRESYERLTEWLAAHGVTTAPADVRVDFGKAGLLRDHPSATTDVTEIHNCAGAYRFGMSNDEARRGNVHSTEAIVSFAATLPRLDRLVHVSGYRVGGQDHTTVPWNRELAEQTYSTLGAYEASKVESDTVLKALAQQLGVAWTIVNPCTVIGDSATGESDQQIGMAANLKELWQGTLTALPGDSSTFVPVVTVDYLARFMSELPTDPSTAGRSYWILDDDTPALPDLLARIGQHYQVKVPRLRIPVSAIKRLPPSLTGADPETLTFLSADRYPTGPAQTWAAERDLKMPDTTSSINRWADHLAAHRFGSAPEADRRFVQPAGIHTFEVGTPGSAQVILPGLPVNADTWADVARTIGQARAVDLPGLGMTSGRGRADWTRWLAALLANSPGAHLIGHSVGAAAALEFAATAAHHVPHLTLVSPFFLQQRAGFPARLTPLTRSYLKKVDPVALSKRLTGSRAHGRALASSVTDLRRRTVNATVASLLAATRDERWRRALRQKLAHHPGRVHLIVGADDPLTDDARRLLDGLTHVSVTTISGAGHHPQLTHPTETARAIDRAPAARAETGPSTVERQLA